MGIPSRQKINKAIVTLNDIIDQLDFSNIYRTLHPKPAEYTFFFKCTQNVLQDRTSARSQSLNKFKTMEVLSTIFFFSDHNGVKLEIIYGKKNGNKTNMWRLIRCYWNKINGSMMNSKGSEKIPLGKWKWKHNFLKPMGYSKSSSKREVHSDTDLPQETRKISNKPPNLPHKRIRKRKKSKFSRRMEIIKIRE